MHLAVTTRRVLARHPWIFWLVCLAVAAAAASLVSSYVTALDQARRDLGATRTVLVAAVDHQPGDPLQVRRADMPLPLLPPDAVDPAVGGVDQAIVRQRVSIGEVVVAADLAAADGPAALAKAGELVVGIVDPLARDVRIGLEVQVVAEGVLLADGARVVGLADDVILVAVDAQAAAVTAAAARTSSASILFAP
jgi:ethanolamine utilization microcompartment shell protein EutL